MTSAIVAALRLFQVDGFNPERIRSLKSGIEITLGAKIKVAAVLDKDYRSDKERVEIIKECEAFCDFIYIYKRKEIENFVLVPTSIDCAARRKVADQSKRSGAKINYKTVSASLLDEFATTQKIYVTSQYIAERRRFERTHLPALHETTVSAAALGEVEASWKDLESRLEVIPAKEALSAINQVLQKEYGVNITPTSIIDAMSIDEMPLEIKTLIKDVSEFSSL
jgi:hypothetical protein